MTTTQVYHVHIRATAEEIWAAITRPELTVRYFHHVTIEVTPSSRSHIGPRGEHWEPDAVLEFDPPHRLVHEWRSQYDVEMAAEPPSRVTWEITPQDGGTCLVTLTHDRLDGSPKTAAGVSGAGWMFVLSSMKSLLETGEALPPTG
jgi:uncharacterized protein YndB with AHSA1/START domain